MRDVYHCPPSVLAEQDAGRVELDLLIMAVEAKAKSRAERAAARRAALKAKMRA